MSPDRAAELTQIDSAAATERILWGTVGVVAAGLAAAQARSRGPRSFGWRAIKAGVAGAAGLVIVGAFGAVRMLQFQHEVRQRMMGWRDRMHEEEGRRQVARQRMK